MATQKQIEANRRNAQKSTGPRTAEGKSRASRNRRTHGMYALVGVLPAVADPEFVDLLRMHCEDEWPHTAALQRVAVEMALCDWEQERARSARHDLWVRKVEMQAHPDSAARDAAETEFFRGLEIAAQYELRAGKAWFKAMDAKQILLGADPATVAADRAQFEREELEADDEEAQTHRPPLPEPAPEQQQRLAAAREAFIQEVVRAYFSRGAQAAPSNWVRIPDLLKAAKR
jgi:hypothetical protein